MVLLVPSEDPSDILKLDYHLSTSAERSESGKAFIDKINAEFKKEFANDFEVKWGRPDVTLTMPLFSLKGSADVHDILKKVSTSLYASQDIMSKLSKDRTAMYDAPFLERRA